MKMNQLSVKTTLTGAFGILAVIVLIVSGISLNDLNEANERFSGFVSGINARAEMAASVRAAVDDRAMAVRNLVLVNTPADVEMEKNAVSDAEQRVETRLEKFNAMVASAPDISDRERSLAAEISRVETLYRPVALEIDRLALSNQRDAAIAEIDVQCRPLLSALIKASNDFADYTHERAAQMVQQSANQFASQRSLLIGICLTAAAMAALAGVIITRGLLRALGAEPVALSEVTRRVAAGDLRPVPGATSAPGDSVLASMGEMQASLVRLIGQVRAAADGIATGSSQIASGNADLSSRTEQQAASLQETASSMEELASMVRHNADNARQATTLAGTASATARRGGEVVGRVVETMQGISGSSAKMSEIISVIEGIAFQTNILALNAAVEAARAGEQGRGFAVVAGEVRTLAQRSATAAKEIKDLISESANRVEAGSKLVDEAGSTINEIVASVKRVTDIVGEISSASEEQSTGIEQVNTAVSQMDRVTQQNAALVEEAAAATESLAKRAHELREAMAIFSIAA